MVQDDRKGKNERDFLKSLMGVNEDSPEYAEKYFHKTLDNYNPQTIFTLILSAEFENTLLEPLQPVLEIAATEIDKDDNASYQVRLHNIQRAVKYFSRREAIRELSRMIEKEGEIIEITEEVGQHIYHHVESRITSFLNGYCKDKIPQENIFWLRLAEVEGNHHEVTRHCHECGKPVGEDKQRAYIGNKTKLYCWACAEKSAP